MTIIKWALSVYSEHEVIIFIRMMCLILCCAPMFCISIQLEMPLLILSITLRLCVLGPYLIISDDVWPALVSCVCSSAAASMCLHLCEWLAWRDSNTDKKGGQDKEWGQKNRNVTAFCAYQHAVEVDREMEERWKAERQYLLFISMWFEWGVEAELEC